MSGAEELVGALEGRPLRPAGQRLEADQRAAVELDERLEDGADEPVVEDPTKLVSSRANSLGGNGHAPGDRLVARGT
jgi:hypothetical protein